ncbi:transcriptional regulator with XRE-family HTH domain [Thalassobacillus pellis]|nr:transcriptional regulator with XRE-family HTH domain [Thalassobacillus pellis]
MSRIKKSKSAQLMKEMRRSKDKTQQQLSVDMFQSREYISKQESGERKIPPVTTKYFIEKYNNPWLALETVDEYIGWGLTRLNGPAANNDNYFLQLMVEKELQEAIEVMTKIKWTDSLYTDRSVELQGIQKSAESLANVVHFSTVYLAALCDNYGINWLKIWKKHHSDLKAKGYINE